MADSQDRTSGQDRESERLPTGGYDDGAIGPGATIGRYKLLRILGEGGYGIVYLAEQQRPVKRRVALKVIKPGMDTKQVVARFEAERQALALLDHPNIAHVFNAGTTAGGHPYFAMEYVKGVPITEHCDRYKFTIEERLKLFLAVCEAVQHAHQKAIIHRDIKPSNILVAYEGEQAVPMIIDFGVAKALTQALTERTLVTEQAQMIGTPEYMSPEQAEMSGQDIDTRTDIYSLGVLLYELLTGTLPFDPQTLREGGPEQMRRMIREQDPQTPSVRLSTIENEKSLSLAQQRRTDIRTWGHHLHGELDWITLKAMDKDRTRRYQTAHALAEDIQRYLNQEPVLAGPPSTAYKVQKFIRRNRAFFVSSAAITAMLIVAVVVSTHQALVARSARRAESIERKTAQQQRDRALEAEKEAQQNLYNALLREANATRAARRVGYREELFNAITQARDLDVAQKDLAELRAEAISCLGDFVGLKPKQMAELAGSVQIWWADLHPTDPVAAMALTDGSVVLRDLHSAVNIAKFEGEYPPRGLCFSHTGNSLLSLHVPGAYTDDEQTSEAVARLCVRDRDGTWIQRSIKNVVGATQCLATDNGFYISVTNEKDCTVEIVEAMSGSVVHQFRYAEEMDLPIVDMACDGRLLAATTGGQANPSRLAIEVWDLVANQHVARLETELDIPTCLKFSSDGKYLALLSQTGGVIYTTEGFKLVGRLNKWFVNSLVEFMPNSTVIVFSLTDKIHFWDWEKQEYVASFGVTTKEANWLSLSHDGSSLLIFGPKRAWLCDVEVSNERLGLAGHSLAVPGVAFSPDGKDLASVGKDDKLRVWNSTDGVLEWERGLSGPGQGVGYSTDGRWLAATDHYSEQVWVWDVNTNQILFELGNGQAAQTWSVQFSPDDRYLATSTRRYGDDRGAIIIWDCGMARSLDSPHEAKPEILSSFSGQIHSFAFAPDGQQLAFVEFEGWSEAAGLYLWRFLDHDKPRLLTGNIRGVGAQMLTFTPDSRRVLVLDTERSIVTYDVSTGQKVGSFPTIVGDDTADWNPITMLNLSPDGRKLAVSSRSTLGVDLWDPQSGELLYSLPEQSGQVFWLAWSPDSQRLAVSRSNGKIDIWNLNEVERVLDELGLAP